MYPSVLTKKPLYSSPHLSLTYTGLPVSSCINGFGLTGLTYAKIQKISTYPRHKTLLQHSQTTWWSENKQTSPTPNTCKYHWKSP